MGVKLMVEVMDHAPEALTPRERYVLLVLAENARDATRICLPGIEDDLAFIRRSRLASRSQRYAVIQALVAKGALERARRGQKWVRAEYRIPALAHPQGPGNQDPEDEGQMEDEEAQGGAQGPGNTDAEASQRPEKQDPEDHPEDGRTGAQGPGSEVSGSRFSVLRVPETRTPYPHTPHTPQESVGIGQPPSSANGVPRKRRRSPKKNEPYREDVERICGYLADKVEANGSKRPDVTNDWRREARLLLDEKRPIPVTVDRVINAIDWAAADHFWHRNILSMPKLRKQWERLRLDRKAELDGKPRQNGHTPPAPKSIPREQQCDKHRGQPGGNRDDGQPRCGQCRAELAGRRTP